MNNDNTSILESLAGLKSDIQHQTETNQDISKKFDKLDSRVASIEATINQAKGGWFAIIAIPAIITAIVNFLFKSHQ